MESDAEPPDNGYKPPPNVAYSIPSSLLYLPEDERYGSLRDPFDDVDLEDDDMKSDPGGTSRMPLDGILGEIICSLSDEPLYEWRKTVPPLPEEGPEKSGYVEETETVHRDILRFSRLVMTNAA